MLHMNLVLDLSLGTGLLAILATQAGRLTGLHQLGRSRVYFVIKFALVFIVLDFTQDFDDFLLIFLIDRHMVVQVGLSLLYKVYVLYNGIVP